MPEEVIRSLGLLGPEIVTVTLLIVLFMVDAFLPRAREGVVPLLLVVAGCIVGSIVTCKITAAPSTFFSGMVASDGLSRFFRYFFFFSCATSLYLAYGSKELDRKHRMEFSLLLVCTTFGMALMAIANNLLALYIGIETVSIVSFVMAGFRRENLRSNEASFKYLVFGALSAGLMLYGFSLIYGYTGALGYKDIAAFFAKNPNPPFALLLAACMVYLGLAYKISAFPMHFWTPDVYEGAPTPVAAFFSVGPKAAGFAALLRICLEVFSVKSGNGTWTPVFAGNALPMVIATLAAITMIVGNLSALGQTNVKRMLAYSSIAHVGYMLMGLVTLNSAGLLAILFYLVAYCGMNIGAFWVVSVVSDAKGAEDLNAFKGMGWNMPVLGVCMAVFLFSLTGIPMFSGFIGKFLIFGAVLQSPGFLWLALLGVLNSVVSLFYYVKVLRAMWLERPGTESTRVQHLPFYQAVGLIALAIPTILLGLFFTPVLQFAERSLSALLS